ncbi:mechanosensitive ion channel protein [Halobacteriales archaeon SW_7_68_16]|nr:MAG: mechanosensitive ion channel protein [Halobacteriales archaeon SW_7_68_16]
MIGPALQTGGTADLDGIADALSSLGVPAEYATLAAGILKFVLAFFVTAYVVRPLAVRIVERLLKRRDLDAHARRPLLKLTSLSLLFVAISVAFGVAGYGSFLTALATVAAAATLAVGFAMQNVIGNFVSGVFIFTDRPFRIGDWIEWNDNTGVVEDVSLRITRVRTFDNELLTVPNSELTDNVVKNPVAKDKLRVQFLFGIGYDDDIDAATEIILEEARAHDGIMDDPEPTVRLTELGDSSVGLKSRVWIADPSRADFVATRGEYVRSVKERFDEAGIDIPYPNRTISGELDIADEAVVPIDD